MIKIINETKRNPAVSFKDIKQGEAFVLFESSVPIYIKLDDKSAIRFFDAGVEIIAFSQNTDVFLVREWNLNIDFKV